MPVKRCSLIFKLLIVAAACAVAGVLFRRVNPWRRPMPAVVQPAVVSVRLSVPRTLDLRNFHSDSAIAQLIDRRKSQLGLSRGIDVVAKANESLKFSHAIVSMAEIRNQILLKRGELIEIDLAAAALPVDADLSWARLQACLAAAKNRWQALRPRAKTGNPNVQAGHIDALESARIRRLYQIDSLINLIEQYQARLKRLRPLNHQLADLAIASDDPPDLIRLAERIKTAIDDTLLDDVYGIYIVQPGDNIWNIHFSFLRNYFQSRGVDLTITADEPHPSGSSSGIGRLLKFSENMAYIYDIDSHRLVSDIHDLSPANKLVIFDLNRITRLLDGIDIDRIDHIRLDGGALWLPISQ